MERKYKIMMVLLTSNVSINMVLYKNKENGTTMSIISNMECTINGINPIDFYFPDQNNEREIALQSFITRDKLYQAFCKCRKGVTWKESVQRFEANLLPELNRLYKELVNETYKPMKPLEFDINERGHIRHIKANHIRDRVVQRSFNDNVLMPRIFKYLIYDNSASVKGRGVSFARQRFQKHLQNSYREYGYNGYVLFLDFSKYFDNIQHNKALEMFRFILNAYEYEFMVNTFKEFEVDLSFLSDEEVDICYNTIFNSLEYEQWISDNNIVLNKSKMMQKSVGIGNQISQITGIYYPHELDNYIKIVLSIKYYGRYMDDSYIIMKSKEDIQNLYNNHIVPKCNELNLFINPKKIRIIPLSSWLTYLKINYKILETSRIIKKVSADNLRREIRRLGKFRHLLNNGIMEFEDIYNCFSSWYGSYKNFDSMNELDKVVLHFNKLFCEELYYNIGYITYKKPY